MYIGSRNYSKYKVYTVWLAIEGGSRHRDRHYRGFQYAGFISAARALSISFQARPSNASKSIKHLLQNSLTQYILMLNTKSTPKSSRYPLQPHKKHSPAVQPFGKKSPVKLHILKLTTLTLTTIPTSGDYLLYLPFIIMTFPIRCKTPPAAFPRLMLAENVPPQAPRDQIGNPATAR